MCGCSDEPEDAALDFVGDSIIARWDLAESFPSRQVYNFGKSGAGIDYLESMSGRFSGKDVVVMIGTNDNLLYVGEDIIPYAGRYILAVEELGAKRVFLYSVLPRCFGTDRDGINADIETFNSIVRKEVSDNPRIVYIDVYSCFIIDGEVNMQLFTDGLHLSSYGYEILGKALTEVL